MYVIKTGFVWAVRINANVRMSIRSIKLEVQKVRLGLDLELKDTASTILRNKIVSLCKAISTSQVCVQKLRLDLDLEYEGTTLYTSEK